jgi:hypothetical protein
MKSKCSTLLYFSYLQQMRITYVLYFFLPSIERTHLTVRYPTDFNCHVSLCFLKKQNQKTLRWRVTSFNEDDVGSTCNWYEVGRKKKHRAYYSCSLCVWLRQYYLHSLQPYPYAASIHEQCVLNATMRSFPIKLTIENVEFTTLI